LDFVLFVVFEFNDDCESNLRYRTGCSCLRTYIGFSKGQSDGAFRAGSKSWFCLFSTSSDSPEIQFATLRMRLVRSAVPLFRLIDVVQNIGTYSLVFAHLLRIRSCTCCTTHGWWRGVAHESARDSISHGRIACSCCIDLLRGNCEDSICTLVLSMWTSDCSSLKAGLLKQ